jgi:S1-C subfamily serine protease
VSDQPTPSEPTDEAGPDAGPSPVLVDPAPVESPTIEDPPLETIPVEEPTAPTPGSPVTDPAPAPVAAPVTEPFAAPGPPPSDPTGPPPWPTTAPGPTGPSGPSGPPTMPPQPPTAPPRRPGAWKQFVVGALVGALVGGATAAGISLATNDDPAGRTVIVRESSDGARNTSALAEPRDIQGILQKVEPAVVAIQTGGAVTGDRSVSGGAGTGFVISEDGVIVTNNHVVEGADDIEVAFTDGTSERAEVLGTSADNDLAVLKVEATGLPFAALGSSEELQVGDEVIAIGNALALDGGLSVTRGIISAKERTVPEQNGARLYSVLQTDAAINPGNSGGPLVNSNGEVVGINTAIANPLEAQNVGFAISIDSARSVIEDLRQGNEVRTAFLGVETEEVTPAVANQLDLDTDSGVVIMNVTSDSAAQAAGLEEEDVIIAVSGTAVTTPDELATQIRKSDPGDVVDIRIERDGSQETIPVTLGTRPQNR